MKVNTGLIALLLSVSHHGLAQHILSGKFTDKTQHPVEYVEVTAARGDSILAGTLSGRSGRFGKVLYKRTLTLKQSVDLGTLSIKPGLQLGEVAVNTHRAIIEQKPDRMVFNIENSVAASGGDLLDALRATPGVQLRGDKITLIGKGAVRVMVDGRILPLQGEALTQYLQSIAADDIKSIEVITTPPARYEAEGDSGLINIVYKSARKDHWNARLRGSYENNTYGYWKGGGHFSYHEDKWSLALSLNGRAGGLPGIDTARNYYPEQTWVETANKKIAFGGLSTRLSLDYAATEKTGLGLIYFGKASRGTIQTNTQMRVYNTYPDLEALIKSYNYNRISNDNQALNLHYIFKPDTTGKVMSLNLDYFNYDRHENADYQSQNYPDQSDIKSNAKGPQQIQNYSAKIDVSRPTKWATLAYGAKLSFIQSDNGNTLFDTSTGTPIPEPDESDRFHYDENTQALYLSASKKFNAQWQAKIGLRLENTQTKGVSEIKVQTHKNDYTKLFPSCYLAYSPRAAHTFSFSYGRRIERPPYRGLDPHRWYSIGTSYVVGNPSLQASFTDHFTLSHSWKKKLISKLQFYNTRNGFEQLPSFNTKTGQQIYTEENYYTTYSYSLQEFFHFKPRPWWQSQAELHLDYIKLDFDPAKVSTRKQAGPLVYLSTNNSLMLNAAHSLQGEINFWYASSERLALLTDAPKYNLDLGIRALLLDKNLEINLAADDVLKSRVPYQTLYVGDVKQVSRYYNGYQRVVLTIKYRIGNKKIKVRQRAFGNEEERSRS